MQRAKSNGVRYGRPKARMQKKLRLIYCSALPKSAGISPGFSTMDKNAGVKFDCKHVGRVQARAAHDWHRAKVTMYFNNPEAGGNRNHRVIT